MIATVDGALKKQHMESTVKLERWKEEMPTEAEMRPKDKYTMFDRKEKRYRKGIHSRWCLCFFSLFFYELENGVEICNG